MTILIHGSWLKNGKITDQMLCLAKKIPDVREQFLKEELDDIQRAILGLEVLIPSITSNMERDVRICKSFVDNGGEIDSEFLQKLEDRVISDPVLQTDVARIHVLCSAEREEQARRAIVLEEIPFVFPGELTSLHVEIFAVGDKALHVLHVDGLKRLAQIAIEALEVDIIHQRMWFYPFLEVIPEKLFIREIRKLARKTKYQGGGIGLLAFYGSKLGMNPENILREGNDLDHFFYSLAKESEVL